MDSTGINDLPKHKTRNPKKNKIMQINDIIFKKIG